MAQLYRIFQFLCVVRLSAAVPALSHRGIQGREISQEPRLTELFSDNHDNEEIEDKENAWELSGHLEGDIMVHPKRLARNALRDPRYRWPEGVIPYIFRENDFDQKQMEIIENGMKEFHEKTCVRFRPRKEGDKDYLIIKGTKTGCWAVLGHYWGGQSVNLEAPGCLYHGTVQHELMHALGFENQQSAPDRDKYVNIHWENIMNGSESMFNKSSYDTLTDFGIGYDYQSITHYGTHDFSKNGKPTITPKEKNVKIGRAEALSMKDILKIKAMYEEECKERGPEIDGSGGGNDPQDSEIDGSGGGNDPQDSEIDGSGGGNDPQDSEIDGSGGGNDPQDSEIDGSGGGNDPQESGIDGSGGGNDPQDSEIDGSGGGNDPQDSEIDGSGGGNDPQESGIDGSGGRNAPQESEIDGSGGGNDSQEWWFDSI